MKNIFIKSSFLIIVLFLFVTCSKDEPEPIIEYSLTTNISPSSGGTVSPSSGTFESGDIITLTSTPNEYYVFKNWSGGVSGTQSSVSVTMNSNKTITVVFEKNDTDEDGVLDSIDTCPNTPSGETVNGSGCSTSQVDSDGDGVMDDVDICSNTRTGVPVDDVGCMLNPIYLDENGITIKCYEWGKEWETGVVNGIEYTIVSWITLLQLGDNGGDGSKYCTSKVTTMREVFSFSQFNQDVSSWDVSNVIDMTEMFRGYYFNPDISSWDVSNVVSMRGMFLQSHFNQDISSWDVSNVNNMQNMFTSSPFNQNISSWDVSNVQYMAVMFGGAPFNQDISSWDVSNVTDMMWMFQSSPFNQDLSMWNVTNVTNCTDFNGYSNSWVLPKPNFTNCNPN